MGLKSLRLEFKKYEDKSDHATECDKCEKSAETLDYYVFRIPGYSRTFHICPECSENDLDLNMYFTILAKK